MVARLSIGDDGSRGPTRMTDPGRRVVEFMIVCLALSWLPWAVLSMLGDTLPPAVYELAFGIAAAGPSLAALAVWIRRRDRHPGPHVRWGLRWPVAAILFGAAAPVVTGVVATGGDLGRIGDHAYATVAGVGIIGALAYTFLAGPVAEEFGWRGFVQPWLRARFQRAATAAIVGVLWGLWHVPLFLLPGTGQYEDGLLSVQGAVFFLELFPLSYLMLLVSETLKGGVPAAILLHAAWNFADEVVPQPGPMSQWLELGVVTVLAVIAAVLARHATRNM